MSFFSLRHQFCKQCLQAADKESWGKLLCLTLHTSWWTWSPVPWTPGCFCTAAQKHSWYLQFFKFKHEIPHWSMHLTLTICFLDVNDPFDGWERQLPDMFVRLKCMCELAGMQACDAWAAQRAERFCLSLANLNKNTSDTNMGWLMQRNETTSSMSEKRNKVRCSPRPLSSLLNSSTSHRWTNVRWEATMSALKIKYPNFKGIRESHMEGTKIVFREFFSS